MFAVWVAIVVFILYGVLYKPLGGGILILMILAATLIPKLANWLIHRQHKKVLYAFWKKHKQRE